MNKKVYAIGMALLAAVLYAVNIPVSKLLLQHIGPIFMAALLYLGAGLGMLVISVFKKGSNEPKLTRKELPYTIGMIVLDIAAPIFLMLGLRSAASANVSLLNNFEIVATSLIALLIFKEKISKLMWAAIGFITVASVLLTFEGMESLSFSGGSLLVLAACICWGFENNCTRMMSSKSAAQIVVLKGIFSGLGSFVVALVSGEQLPQLRYVLPAMMLGFVSYGLSIYFYVKAQNQLGAARTSAYYSVNPFAGALLSLLLLRESLAKTYPCALIVMIVGAVFAVVDTLLVEHSHVHTHTVARVHGGGTDTVTHEHTHRHLLAENHSHHHHRRGQREAASG